MEGTRWLGNLNSERTAYPVCGQKLATKLQNMAAVENDAHNKTAYLMLPDKFGFSFNRTTDMSNDIVYCLFS